MLWRLTHRIKSAEPQVRIEAARQLALVKDGRGAPVLISALSDPEPSVRNTIIQSLAQIGRPAIPLLTWLLEQVGDSRQAHAAGALAQMAEHGIEPLTAALKHPDRSVRRLAVHALGHIGELKTIDTLSAVIREDWDADVRTAAVQALARMLKPAVEPLIRLLQDWNCWVRSAAADALGQIRDERAVEPLALALGDKEANVREAAATAITRIGGSHAACCLVRMVGSGSPEVRQAVERTLVRLGDAAVEPLCEGLVSDSFGEWRVRFVELLGELGRRGAVEPLVPLLTDRDTDVRQAAARVLAKLGWKPTSDAQRSIFAVAAQRWDDVVACGPQAAEYLAAAVADVRRAVRVPAIRCVGQIGGPSAVPMLLPLLADRVPDVARAAAEALGMLRAEASIDALCAALGNADVIEAALQALGAIGSVRAVPGMIAALQWMPPTQHSQVVDAVVRMGSAAVDALLLAVTGGSPAVRASAARALGRLRDPRADEALRRLTEDADPTVRMAAGEALSLMGLDSA